MMKTETFDFTTGFTVNEIPDGIAATGLSSWSIASRQRIACRSRRLLFPPWQRLECGQSAMLALSKNEAM